MKCPFCIKVCTKCKRILVAYKGNFGKQKTGKYGFETRCKECSSKYHKQRYKENPEYFQQYYQNNKEHKKEWSKEYYQNNKEHKKEWQREYNQNNKEHKKEWSKEYYQNNKEHLKAYQKEYYQNNEEVIKERVKQYRQNNSEHLKEYNKQWRADNPHLCFNYNNKRRQLEEEQGRGITKEQWFDMMNFFEWRCAYSGEYLGGKTDNRSIDHIIPLTKGGLNEPWNCIPMIKSYNKSKQTKDINEWYITQDFYSEERLNKIYEWQEYAYNKYYEEQ